MARKYISLEDLLPHINGAGDELLPYAHKNAKDYFDGRTGAVKGALSDWEADLSDAFETWGGYEDGTPEKRAALIRLGACLLRVMAIDAVSRGDKACDRIAERMSDTGHLK
jgi:hypothetical protein